ncbi:hypothetical protein [Lactiplantibacillus daowaiensis]|uniref:Integral membrane protein n=1 Tax=Lactiplantibacillus daowaiensis TaxID=2559918 RepID=A0ABW1RYP4_9LACO|nr:hypothetical protein [Lactiplantibacillus daowaiensis]
MAYIIAFFTVMVFMLLGEWVSSLTHAYIPSVFITAILFMVGFWTVLPKNIALQASYGTQFSSICVTLLLVHLGTLMSLKELLAQWKAVCIALLGVLGTLALTLSVGTMIFNWQTVVAAVPPLTGGLVSALLMTSGLKAQGVTTLVALPVSMFVIHSVVGYPLTAVLLKKEGRRLKHEFNTNGAKVTTTKAATTAAPATQYPLHMPEKFQTPAFIMARVALIGLLSNWVASLMNGAINANVICLIFGVIAHQVGFLEDNALTKAGVFHWLMYGLLAYVFSQLSVTTPSLMGTIIVQIIVLIALGLIGMFLASWLLAKPFGMTWYMAYSCSLTALFGFPADFILTNEVASQVADNDGQKQYLLDHMMPKMLVGGFATVSVASVIIASIFLKLI